MKTRFRLFITVSLLIAGVSLTAQENNLPSDTFRVVKEYQPILIDADKIISQPEINDTFKIETKLDYSFVNKTLPVSFNVEPISPARIKGEPLVKLYNGYARAGVGNAMLPFGEVYYTNKRSKEYAWGAHAKYFRQGELNQIEGSDMSRLKVEAFGKRFWKTNTLEGRLGFDQHAMNYYGYYRLPRLFNEELAASELEQQYSTINGDFSLKSTKQDSFNLRHHVQTHYHRLSNTSGDAEQQFKTVANFSQFVEQELYQLDVVADFNKYDLNEASNIFALKPKISTIGDKFRIDAGLGMYMNAEDETTFHFYPIAEVKYNVIEDVLIPYAGLKGGIERLNYQRVTQENPFVAENILMQNSNQKYNIYAGLRGTLSKQVSFNASVARIRTEDDYLYLKLPELDEVLSKDFYLTYDDINEWQIKGELVYRMNEKIQLYALGEYFQFDTENQTEAWHRPELKVSVRGEYNLRDKIIARADIFYWGEQYALGVSEITIDQNNTILNRIYRTETLNAIVDLNLGFEYRYTKKLSAFVQFNNIGGINYQKYQDYPLQGFNFWGGLTYAF